MIDDVLPFTAVQTDGVRTIRFPLHTHTVNPRHVGAVLEAVLAAVTERIRAEGGVSDGDLLQGICMAMAIRMDMVDAQPAAVRALVARSLEEADEAVAESVVRPGGKA